MAIPKAISIPVILINTNRYNVWIRQPLLAAELFDVECDEMEYRANMNWDGNILVSFQPVPQQLINTNSCQVEAGPVQLDSPKIERPKFGPRLDRNSAEFNFEKELDQLPCQLNIRKEAKFMQDQQSQFINLVYDNKEVLSLHDEDLGYCDLIKHTIPITTEKPVYFCSTALSPDNSRGKCKNVWIPGCTREL